MFETHHLPVFKATVDGVLEGRWRVCVFVFGFTGTKGLPVLTNHGKKKMTLGLIYGLRAAKKTGKHVDICSSLSVGVWWDTPARPGQGGRWHTKRTQDQSPA